MRIDNFCQGEGSSSRGRSLGTGDEVESFDWGALLTRMMGGALAGMGKPIVTKVGRRLIMRRRETGWSLALDFSDLGEELSARWRAQRLSAHSVAELEALLRGFEAQQLAKEYVVATLLGDEQAVMAALEERTLCMIRMHTGLRAQSTPAASILHDAITKAAQAVKLQTPQQVLDEITQRARHLETSGLLSSLAANSRRMEIHGAPALREFSAYTASYRKQSSSDTRPWSRSIPVKSGPSQSTKSTSPPRSARCLFRTPSQRATPENIVLKRQLDPAWTSQPLLTTCIVL